MKKIAILLFLSLLSINLRGAISIEVGQSTTLYCTKTPPLGGWFDRVAFTLSNSNDSQYLLIENNFGDQSAKITGRAPKASIPIEIICSYAYMGSYDKKIHVGSFSYYEYVTVTGGVTPTSVKIISPTTMEVGETITMRASLSPVNATTVFTWGTVSTLGKPFNFTLTPNGAEAELYAKKEGTVYVVVETENGKQNMLSVTAVSSPITEISFPAQNVTIGLGQDYKLDVDYKPANSSRDNIDWTSSDSGIVSVSSDGVVHGIAPGEVSITARSKSNSSVCTSCKVKCLPLLSVDEGNTIKISGLQNAYKVGDRIPVMSDMSLVWTLDGKTIQDISEPLTIGQHTIRLRKFIDGRTVYSIKYEIKVEE